MEKLKASIFLILLFALAGISCYFFYKTIFIKTTIKNTVQTKPDVTISNLKSINFNKDGDIALKLNTPVMYYYSSTRNSHLVKPHILVYRKNKAPWNITANKGLTINNQSEYKLIGNVRLHQGPNAKTQSITIKTPELTIYPDKQIALTKQRITFTQKSKDNSSITVHSIGARANQKTGEIKLLSNTRGTYNETQTTAKKK